jgi:subtilase family serine protease
MADRILLSLRKALVRYGRVVALAFLAVALQGTLGVGSAGAAPSGRGQSPAMAHSPFHHHVCGPVNTHFLRCHADVVTDSSANPLASSAPVGYGPSDLQSAYALASAAAQKGTGQTVALVDAYDDPNAASDLGVYRSQYGLPACTSASGCFRKVNQTGGTTYPRANVGWAEEISLDLDMVSAICPNCHILLVEASSNSISNLGAAVDEAAALGATQISNSYGGSEYSGEVSDQSYYNHPGIAVTVSSGDNGYGAEFPAASQYVTAVGGTTLTQSSSTPRGWSETAWSGAGSGCSAYISKPSWQTDTGCSKRTVADVSADADPNTGVAVYDTYNEGGWLEFGGTSVASPIIASTYALIGSAAAANYGSYPYAHPSWFNDVTSGGNGSCGTYLCTGVVGYDGPTGIGTPAGVAHPTFTAAPGTVAPGAAVTASWSGVSSSTSTDWVGVYAPGSGSGSYLNWVYDDSCTQTAGSTALASGSCPITMPTTPGTYELRLYAANGFTLLATSQQITVNAPTLSASPTSVGAGGSVTASWGSVGNPSTTDWIGVYTPGSGSGSYINWVYDDSCTQTAGSTTLGSGSCSITMPTTPGTYELRLYAANGYTLLATSSQITVS